MSRALPESPVTFPKSRVRPLPLVVLFACALVAWAAPAVAAEPKADAKDKSGANAEVSDAEHVRLSSEIKQLATRQAWAGVEKKYEELEKLGFDLDFDDLLHGAYAARALGDAQSAYDRLQIAAKLKGTKEVVDWLYAIDTDYGRVELIATPPRGITLEAELMPFDPDQRTCVTTAISDVTHDGEFLGLLPKGKYMFAGTAFEVQPGIAVRIEVAPRMKKTTGEVVNVSATPIDTSATPPIQPGDVH